MKLVKFELGEVRKCTAALAQRQAVFDPFFRVRWASDNRLPCDDPGMDAGYPRLGKFLRMANCPSFGIGLDLRRRRNPTTKSGLPVLLGAGRG